MERQKRASPSVAGEGENCLLEASSPEPRHSGGFLPCEAGRGRHDPDGRVDGDEKVRKRAPASRSGRGADELSALGRSRAPARRRR